MSSSGSTGSSPSIARIAAHLLLTLAAAGLLGALPSLATSDLTWCYAYMSPDSWDWLVNGAYWNGGTIQPSFRPPGLPLVIALLSRLEILPLLPALNFAMLGLTGLLLHRLVRGRHPPPVAALATLLFLSNGSLFGYARFVMAEVWTLPFLVGASIQFARAEAAPRRLVGCALLLASGFLFHYAAAIVGVGLALGVIFFRRESLRSRWPWLALVAAMPIPAAWLLFRSLGSRPGSPEHVVEALVRPSLDHIAYYVAASLALLGLATLPLHVAGFARLLPRSGERFTPWAQAVLLPLASLALFFGLAYDWADKRFLYYLLPFAVALAAEGIGAVLDFARGGRLRATFALIVLTVALLWNRIPYPAAAHTLLALGPRHFLETGGGLAGARVAAVDEEDLAERLRDDGFLRFDPPALSCRDEAASLAAPEIRHLLDSRLAPDAPVALAGTGGSSTEYWMETNQLTLALGRPVEKPATARFVLRRSTTPDRRALARVGPFELFDLEAVSRSKRRRHRPAKTQQEPSSVEP